MITKNKKNGKKLCGKTKKTSVRKMLANHLKFCCPAKQKSTDEPVEAAEENTLAAVQATATDVSAPIPAGVCPMPSKLTAKERIGKFGKTLHLQRRQMDRHIDDRMLEKVIEVVSVSLEGRMFLIAQPSFMQRNELSKTDENLVIIIDLDRDLIVTAFFTNKAGKYIWPKMQKNCNTAFILS